MACCRSSDCIAINDQDEKATLQPVELLIVRGFSIVDLHLCEEGNVPKSDSSDRVLISTVDQEEL